MFVDPCAFPSGDIGGRPTQSSGPGLRCGVSLRRVLLRHMLVLLQFLINIDAKLSSSCLDFPKGCGVIETSGCYVLPIVLEETIRTQVLFSSA